LWHYSTRYVSYSIWNLKGVRTHNAIFSAVPVPPPSPALLAALFACAAEVHDTIAALSTALRVDAVAPTVPSYAIAAVAAAGMVRELLEVAPARTVAMLVVLRTEAWADARSETIIIGSWYFIIAICWKNICGVWEEWLQKSVLQELNDRPALRESTEHKINRKEGIMMIL
jgi:hypothetical protein